MVRGNEFRWLKAPFSSQVQRTFPIFSFYLLHPYIFLFFFLQSNGGDHILTDILKVNQVYHCRREGKIMPLTPGRTVKINNCFHEDKLPLPPFSQGGTACHWCGTARGQPPTPQEIKHWGERHIIYNLQIHTKTIWSLLVRLLHDIAFSFLQRWREDHGMHYWFQLQSAQSYDRRHIYENTHGCFFFISLCASALSLSPSPRANNSLTTIHWNTERRRTCINILRWCLQILAVIKTTQQSEFTLSLLESQQSPRVFLCKREKRSGATRPDAALFHLGGWSGRYRSCSYLKQTPAVWQPGCLLHPQNINILLTHLWVEDKTPSLLEASKQHKGSTCVLQSLSVLQKYPPTAQLKIGSVGIRSAQCPILARRTSVEQ